MSYKVLQRRTDRGWEDYMPVIGPRHELGRMHVEKVLGERTRWKPETDPKKVPPGVA